MKVYNLFSKRNNQTVNDDVYIYDDLPTKLRVQIVHIIQDAFGTDPPRHDMVKEVFQEMHDVICREEGVFNLQFSPREVRNDFLNYFLKVESWEKALDVVELAFRTIERLNEDFTYMNLVVPKIDKQEAIDELNHRFKEASIGYRYEARHLIKISDEFTHKEIIKPTINLINNKKYKSVNEEFLNAHTHFRHGRYKECLNDSLKSFESMLKLVCVEKGWTFKAKDTAITLIKTVIEKKLIPDFMLSQISAIRSVLESGIPTIRNRLGGHGQGDKTIVVDEYIAHYMPNITGATILLLGEAKQSNKCFKQTKTTFLQLKQMLC